MVDLIPVDHDPFAPQLVPVDHDPFDQVQTSPQDWSRAVGPAVLGHLGDVMSGKVAAEALPNTYDPNVSFAQNARNPAGIQQAMDVAMGVSGPGLAIKAYHGSPHDFERFDMSKIGTGEGAQAYGHGLYFAEHEPVARGYRDALVGRNSTATERFLEDNSGSLPKWAADQIEQYPVGHEYHSGVIDGLTENFKNSIAEQDSQWQMQPWIADANKKRMQSIIDNLARLKTGEVRFAPKPTGRMYEASINAEPEHFLDWDKPLNQQSVKVQEALGWTPDLRAEYDATTRGVDDALLGALKGGDPAAVDALARRAQEINRAVGVPRDATGADIVKGNSIFDRPSDAAASAKLREAGIPGIRYLDQGSRNAAAEQMLREDLRAGLITQAEFDAKTKATHNYVVFDDKLIDIIKKYGLGALIAGGAATIPGAEGQAQHLIPVEHDPFAEVRP